MSQALFLGGMSFLLAVVWGGPLIRFLRSQHIGDQIRIEGPQTHQVKMGTPTMGGLMILTPVVLIIGTLTLVNLISTAVRGRPITNVGESVLVPVGTLVAFGLLGALDDWVKVRGRRLKGEGMSGRRKFAIQVGIALVVALVLHFGPTQLRSVALPGVPQKIDIGLLWIPIAVFWIVGMSNAVNLTDGMDGLAGIITATAFLTYGIIAYWQSFQGLEPGSAARVSTLAPFSLIMVGALLAFLWYNAHPAQLFMGDTGSLAIGATLGVVALMTGQWLLLPIVALVPIVETLAVILQVAYFKYTRRRYGEGRRLFKMAPLHNHFELLGWSETQVVQRFWLIGIWSAMVGMALALL
ncbi:MAG TPA: phospho-N-acetylmuramoyl-pentapeptide-transferase [Anaerolineae bacterium]|nr:phospho-N-acetylmuramoyl-pentapeptide-transferase [Anaerolineae bacterium]